jgi:basic membrane protein A
MKFRFLALIAAAAVLAGCSEAPKAPAAKKKVILVTPEKIGVNPFFQQEADGLTKAAADAGFESKVVESADAASIETNLRAAVADGYDLIITSSFESTDALTKVATENPSKQFAIVDTVVSLPNVRSIGFREHEAAYLVGAVAGLVTKTNTVGIVVALDIPLLKKWTSGYTEGVKAVNPKAKVLVNYVGSFTDPAKAKEIALQQFAAGADFINGASAVGDLGVFDAAKAKNFLTSGQDVDHTSQDPDHVVISQLKGTDVAVAQTVKDFASGTFAGGVVEYGLKEDGVGVTYVTRPSATPLNARVGQAVIDKVKAIKDDIVSGKVVVTDPLKK